MASMLHLCVVLCLATALAQEVSVSTESSLLAALGNPSVLVIRLLQDIQLSSGSKVPGGNAAGIYVLQRNVTITAPKETAWYPTLDFAYSGAKIKLPAGYSLTLQHLIIKRLTRQLGTLEIDIIERTSLGYLLGFDLAHEEIACVTPDAFVKSYSTQSIRPAFIPGNQSSSLTPSTWCAPPKDAGGNPTCWPSFYLIDVALNTSFYDLALQSPQINLYIGWMRNASYICDQVILTNDACSQQYGSPTQCWAALLNEAVRVATTSPPPPPDASHPPGSSSSSSAFPAWAIGVIVAVAVLLTALIAGAVVVVLASRRRRQRRDAAAADLLALKVGDEHGRAVALLQAPDGGVGRVGEMVKQESQATHSDSFDASVTSAGGNMYDECWTATATVGPRAPTKRVDAGELVNQMTTKSAVMRDEQLELIKVLGRGGGGIVYQGLWKGLPVAAKVMIVHEEQHDQARRQILEATMSTSLSHPNIVITYNYDLRRLGANPGVDERQVISEASGFATAWQLIILQELCKGGAMRRMIDKKVVTFAGDGQQKSRALTLKHVLMLAHDVSSGLEHLHSKNVVHSDMTANNVLLQATDSPRPAGLQWVAKVADFGLSNAIEDGRSQISRVFAGTPHYIAPETQLHGVISKSSDVFAFGILLYEMMCGSSVASGYAKAGAGGSSSNGGCSARQGSSPLRPVDSGLGPSRGGGGGSLTDSAQGGNSGQGAYARSASDTFHRPAPAAAPANLRRGDSVTTAPLPKPRGRCGSGGGNGHDAAGLRAPNRNGSNMADFAQVVIEIAEETAAGVGGDGGGSGRTSAASGAPSVISPTSSNAATVLMGGGRGQQGGSVALAPLPPTVPTEYVLLVEACLSPLPQDRPTIPVVRRRLAQLVEQYVMSEEPVVVEGIVVSSLHSGSSEVKLGDEIIPMLGGGGGAAEAPAKAADAVSHPPPPPPAAQQ